MQALQPEPQSDVPHLQRAQSVVPSEKQTWQFESLQEQDEEPYGQPEAVHINVPGVSVAAEFLKEK